MKQFEDALLRKQNINAMLVGMLSEKELAKAQEEFSVEGQICLLLNNKVEKVAVPAGEFECIKVVYTQKSKMLLFSDTVEVTEWYAEGIGLVKQEEANKKSDWKKIKLLKRVE